MGPGPKGRGGVSTPPLLLSLVPSLNHLQRWPRSDAYKGLILSTDRLVSWVTGFHFQRSRGGNRHLSYSHRNFQIDSSGAVRGSGRLPAEIRRFKGLTTPVQFRLSDNLSRSGSQGSSCTLQMVRDVSGDSHLVSPPWEAQDTFFRQKSSGRSWGELDGVGASWTDLARVGRSWHE